jgi:hypothetical protein
MVFLSLGNPDEYHRYLHASTHYYGVSHDLKSENFPPNDTIAGLAEGLAEGHRAYGVPGYAGIPCLGLIFAYLLQCLHSFRCSGRRA